jgi:hypothetical protein
MRMSIPTSGHTSASLGPWGMLISPFYFAAWLCVGMVFVCVLAIRTAVLALAAMLSYAGRERQKRLRSD